MTYETQLPDGACKLHLCAFCGRRVPDPRTLTPGEPDARAMITPGERINRRAELNALSLQLQEQIEHLEKLSRTTPPKTLPTARARVELAKTMLPALRAKLAEVDAEIAGLMGFPADWTATESSETPSSPSAPKSSDESRRLGERQPV